LNRKGKAERILRQLSALYPRPPIPLDHADPFTLLVAVVLSAQTTDKKVNEVTPKLFEVAPTPEAMAELSVEEIRSIIREIGLAPQKAKALRGLAERLVAEHHGLVPKDFEELVKLPGVGRKTANVVMAQAFGVPSFPVDTHIHRLAHRWGLSTGKTPDDLEEDLKKLFPEQSWNDVHLQIIYFGREHCPARYHDFAKCPICSWAASKAAAKEEKLRDQAVHAKRRQKSGRAPIKAAGE
jgi:endonuclease-3